MDLKPKTGVSRLCELRGGPCDGLVVEAYGDHPAIFLSEPRDRSLMDAPGRTLTWVPKVKWYEEEMPE